MIFMAIPGDLECDVVFKDYYQEEHAFDMPAANSEILDWAAREGIKITLIANISSSEIPTILEGDLTIFTEYTSKSQNNLSISNLSEITREQFGETSGKIYLGFDNMNNALLFKITWL